MRLKAPFPYFGGKSRIADVVWARLGDVNNYVEPFFGSGAVLLMRPHRPKYETVNDRDCFLANFWRAVQSDPDAVAHYADWPVNEADLHARHGWLVSQLEFRERMMADPDYFDAKIAGWWVWGISCWIGTGWCDGIYVRHQRPHLKKAHGIHQLSAHSREDGLKIWMRSLSSRLRHVRVCCGDWSRVCGRCVMVENGLTGVFLDPPYTEKAGRYPSLYAVEDLTVGRDVAQWAAEQGDSPMMRIALCGYGGEYDLPGWTQVAWKAHGGYGLPSKRGNARKNRTRETIWFSPHCLTPTLFDWQEEAGNDSA